MFRYPKCHYGELNIKLVSTNWFCLFTEISFVCKLLNIFVLFLKLNDSSCSESNSGAEFLMLFFQLCSIKIIHLYNFTLYNLKNK